MAGCDDDSTVPGLGSTPSAFVKPVSSPARHLQPLAVRAASKAPQAGAYESSLAPVAVPPVAVGGYDKTFDSQNRPPAAFLHSQEVKMRVNVYAEEMTDRVEIVSKTIDGKTYTGVRFYLELPVTMSNGEQYSGRFLHRDGDDDSAAVTFWGKRALREALVKAIVLLDRSAP